MAASWKGLKVFSLFDRDTIIRLYLMQYGIINKFNVFCTEEKLINLKLFEKDQ